MMYRWTGRHPGEHNSVPPVRSRKGRAWIRYLVAGGLTWGIERCRVGPPSPMPEFGDGYVVYRPHSVGGGTIWKPTFYGARMAALADARARGKR